MTVCGGSQERESFRMSIREAKRLEVGLRGLVDESKDTGIGGRSTGGKNWLV
jgi:hypothetical protein